MMIPPAVGNPYAAAAALDRQLRSSGNGASDASPADSDDDASPDVVVTLSQGGTSSPATYDASGKMSGAPTLDDLGANGPNSLAHASESHGDDDASDTSAPDAANAHADQDAAVPA